MIRDARDLALVDAALEAARRSTRRRLRELAKGRPRLSPEERRRRREEARARHQERVELRERMCDTPLPLPWSDDAQAWADSLYDGAVAKLEREPKHSTARLAMAKRMRELAPSRPEVGIPGTRGEWLTRSACLRIADKLERARRRGWYGRHIETGRLHFRFLHRSGQRLLDPSEARRDVARTLRRVVPAIRALIERGYRAYFVVFTLPNVPAGQLAQQQHKLFRKFQADILGRTLDGRIDPRRPLSEIVASFTVQEAPLSARGDWHPHLNAVLIVDPRRCTRLAPELEQPELPMTGHAIVKFPGAAAVVDRTPPGCLSYLKLRRAWGRHYQIEAQPIRGDADAIARSMREVLKYTVKWVSSKQLDELAASGASVATREASPELLESAPTVPGGEVGARTRDGGRPVAPCVTDWPLDRLAEWLIANHRFRRVRSSGLLYPLPPDELPPNPEAAGKLRFLGRFYIEPRGIVVHAPRVAFIGSIHGDKSGSRFPGSEGRSTGPGARAGPISRSVPA